MRLICPKCDAQYNVADDAIPKGGRDVQCSTCGHTWFQTEMSRVLSRPVSRVLSRPIPTAVKSEPREAAMATSRDVAAYDVPHKHKEPSKVDGPRHRPVDENIARILREEAGREHDVPAPTKTQTPPPPKTSESKPVAATVDKDETRQRIASLTETEGGTRTGEKPTFAAVTTGNPRAVPSLSEINGVLRARESHSANAELTEAERIEAVRRRGFRRGFFTVLLLFAVAIIPYVLADEIVANLPQSRETMTGYVMVVDQLRVTMNATISGIIESLRALTGQG
ncbi:zinc-ribbon domain-containing protein [Yoonia sp.]|uniref:zinc-ribbon domain-containing protein n=1 Tax=Yoonia sp. TaxID=2212373 RepID=UPI002FD9DCE0